MRSVFTELHCVRCPATVKGTTRPIHDAEHPFIAIETAQVQRDRQRDGLPRLTQEEQAVVDAQVLVAEAFNAELKGWFVLTPLQTQGEVGTKADGQFDEKTPTGLASFLHEPGFRTIAFEAVNSERSVAFCPLCARVLGDLVELNRGTVKAGSDGN